MNAPVKAIPGQAVTPYLCVRGGLAALAFYENAFGARELLKIEHAGRVGHAEFAIGDAKFMLSDEFPEMDVLSPHALGGSPVVIHLYVEDVDAFARRAVAAGLRVLRPVEDQFYGDRGGKFEDPFGHKWWLATHREDVPHDELMRRAAALYATSGS